MEFSFDKLKIQKCSTQITLTIHIRLQTLPSKVEENNLSFGILSCLALIKSSPTQKPAFDFTVSLLGRRHYLNVKYLYTTFFWNAYYYKTAHC